MKPYLRHTDTEHIASSRSGKSHTNKGLSSTPQQVSPSSIDLWETVAASPVLYFEC